MATPQAGADNIEALAGERSDLARKHRLHFQRVTIAEVPGDYEQRLVRVFATDFTQLRLFAFEAQDLVLSSFPGITRKTWRMQSFWPWRDG